MNSRHNLTKSKFSAMLHRQCKVNGICKLKSCYAFTWLTVLHCDFERPKVLKFWDGCVHTSTLMICVCFSNCCFGILLSMSFSFKQSICQVNLGSQCQKTACRKKVSGNTLHYHTWRISGPRERCRGSHCGHRSSSGGLAIQCSSPEKVKKQEEEEHLKSITAEIWICLQFSFETAYQYSLQNNVM